MQQNQAIADLIELTLINLYIYPDFLSLLEGKSEEFRIHQKPAQGIQKQIRLGPKNIKLNKTIKK